eukprot:12104838-Alexandrium_andersonii.AAC.1
MASGRRPASSERKPIRPATQGAAGIYPKAARLGWGADWQHRSRRMQRPRRPRRRARQRRSAAAS